MRRPSFLVGLAGLLLTLGGCTGTVDDAPGPVPVATTPPVLSAWNLLVRDGETLEVRGDAVPYDLNTPLFTDYAHKLRTVWMPKGAVATVDDGGVIQFPVGTVITKTFYYPRSGAGPVASSDGSEFDGRRLDLRRVRLMETRILVRRTSGWDALPYVWNDEGTEARLSIAGAIEPVGLSVRGERQDFSYVVPTQAECASCHAWDHTQADIRPIGPRLRHLDRSFDYVDGAANQLASWQQRGLLANVPTGGSPAPLASWPPAPDGDLALAARSYLDINCGHCHSPIGPADTSGLYLHWEETSLRRLGACKQPIAAGRGSGGRPVSIWPGDPARSILHFRMTSRDPAQMMPEIGRSLVHEEGVALIGNWIRSLEGDCVSML